MFSSARLTQAVLLAVFVAFVLAPLFSGQVAVAQDAPLIPNDTYDEVIRTLPPEAQAIFDRDTQTFTKPIFTLGYRYRRYTPICNLLLEGGIAFFRNTESRSLRGQGTDILLPASQNEPALALARLGLTGLGTEQICYGTTLSWKFGHWGPRTSALLDYGHTPGVVDGQANDRLDFRGVIEQPVFQQSDLYMSLASEYELIQTTNRLEGGEDVTSGEHSAEFLFRMSWRPFPLQKYSLDTGYRLGIAELGDEPRRAGVGELPGSIVAYLSTQAPLGAAETLGAQFGIVVDALARVGIDRQYVSSTCARDTSDILRGYPGNYRLGDACFGGSIQLRFTGNYTELEYNYVYLEFANLLGFNYDVDQFPDAAEDKSWYLSSVSAGLAMGFGDVPMGIEIGIGWPLTDLPADDEVLESLTGFASVVYRH